MPVYPVGLLLTGTEVAVVGGDAGASDKVGKLLDAAARVTVFAPELTDDALKGWVKAGQVKHVARWLDPKEVGAFRLVLSLRFGANDYHHDISAACRKERVLVNCFDLPAISDFSHPAQLRRGLLQIAIFTSGASPALGRTIRESLEKAFDDAFVAWLDELNEIRERVKKEEGEFEKRRTQLYKAIEGFVLKVEAKLPRR